MENKEKFNASEIVGLIVSLAHSLFYLRFIYVPIWQELIYYTSRRYSTEAAIWESINILIPNIFLALFFAFAPIRPKYKIIYSFWLVLVCLILIFYGFEIFPKISLTPFLLPIALGFYKYYRLFKPK